VLFLAGFLFFLATNLMAGWLYFLAAFLVALLLLGLFSASRTVRSVEVEEDAGVIRGVEGGEVAVPVLMEGRRGARFLRVAVTVGERRGEVFIPRVSPGERVRTLIRMPAPPRGSYPAPRLEIISSGLVGMFRARRAVAARGELLVRPRFQVLSAVPSGVEGEGDVVPGRRRGEELGGVREYQPGDPARHIHWRSSRRHRRLIVKEFDDPAAPATAVVLDASSGQTSDAFDRAVRAAASLLYTALGQGREAALCAVDGRGPLIIRGAWERHWDALARLRADGPSLGRAIPALGNALAGAAPVVVTARPEAAPRGVLVVGPEGTECPWEFEAEGGVRRRWRA